VRVTNQYGAPEQFVAAVQRDRYSRGESDFSATQLLRPPQMARLEAEHEDKLSSDVSDMVFALLGSGVHSILEGCAPDGAIVERRWFAEASGYVVSGAIDLYHDGHISDYKVTGTYSAINVKEEWEQQLNIYAWLLRQNDQPVNSLTIIAVCRDWMRSKIGTRNYPQSPIVQIKLPLWPAHVAEQFVLSRVAMHTSEDVAPCSDSERWMNRSGVYIRCESYCAVSDFCPQHTDPKGGIK